MADKNAEVAVEDNGGMKKTLSLWNFFTIGFGAIIGTGWVLQVGDWMVVGGGPVPAMIAFLLGAIFLVPVGAVFGELTAAIPISGGIVEYVDRSFGRTLSYITGWLLALGNGILCPWEAIAISTLVSEMFGSLPGLVAMLARPARLAALRQPLKVWLAGRRPVAGGGSCFFTDICI